MLGMMIKNLVKVIFFNLILKELWQELRASLLKTITRKENVFISWVMRLLIVVSLAWTGWAITLVFYLLTIIAFWITRNQMAQQVAA